MRSQVTLSFDRGTILVRGSRDAMSETAALSIPGLLWDSRVAALRATGHCDQALRLALREAGVAYLVRGRPPLRLAAALRPPALRPYQQQALECWSRAGYRGLIALPTGSGKTRVAIAALAQLGRSAIICVPTRVLLSQWQAALRQYYDLPIGVLGDGQHSVAPLTVSTFESAYRKMDQIGDRFEVLVVDEAHHFGAGVRAEALEMCVAPHRLGLTATPPRDADARAQLETLVGPVVFQLGIADLAGKHLSPFDRIRLYVALSDQEAELYRAARMPFRLAYSSFRRSGSRSYAEFVRAASATAEGRRALRGFTESRRIVANAEAKLALAGRLLGDHRADRSLLFTADNAAAYELSRRLLIPAITCDIGRPEREAILGRLRDGTIHAIVSSRVLNEGIDLPDARVGIVLGGTQGEREHVQRVGRLLRPQRGKRAVVYELVARDTHEEQTANRRQRCLVA